MKKRANNIESVQELLIGEDQKNFVLTEKTKVLTIKLKSNPSTGFLWFLHDYDHSLLTPVRHSFEKTKTNLAGVRGFEYFTFSVNTNAFKVPQHSSIRFIYQRPNQGIDGSTLNIFRFVTDDKKN